MQTQEPQARTQARFYLAPKQDEAATKEAGRPIFRDAPHIEIFTPGDPGNIIKRAAHINTTHPASDNNRFPREWEAFQRGQSQELIEGTPLDKLPGITASQVVELRHFRVRTVEQLASLADGLGQGMMGFQSLKQKARAWLDAAAGNAPMEKMRAELAQRDAALDELRAQVAELSARRGPGRPPKNAEG